MNQDQTQNNSPQPDTQKVQPSGYLVRHNDTIVGVFDNEFDANDALSGYQMTNDIQLNDVLDILQVI